MDPCDMNATLNRAMRDNMTEARSFSESSEVSFNLSVLEITDIAEDKYNSKLTAGGDYVVAAYVLLNILLSLLCNGFVMFVAWRSTRRYSMMQTIIFHLAVCGFTPALFSYPFIAISSMNHRWTFGYIGCVANAFVIYYCAVVSVTLLTVISVIRYLSICHPKILNSEMKKRRSLRLVITYVYVYALVCASPPLAGWGAYGVELYGTACSLDWLTIPVAYLVFMFTFVYVIPVGVMTFCYARVIMAAKRAMSCMSSSRKRWDLYLTKRAILLCACFIVAWTPYAIFSFITSFFGVEISLELTTLPSMFAKSSTMYNPIIYFFLVKTYREEVKQFLPKRFRRIPRLRLIEDTTSRKQQKSGDS